MRIVKMRLLDMLPNVRVFLGALLTLLHSLAGAAHKLPPCFGSQCIQMLMI
jgi:hypothetical protein